MKKIIAYIIIPLGILFAFSVSSAFATYSGDFEIDDIDALIIESASQSAGIKPDGSDFSIEVWLKTESIAADFGIWDHHNGGNNYRIYWDDSADDFVLAVYDLGTTSATVHTWTYDYSVLGTWKHLAVIWDDSTRTATLYVNGVSQGNSSASGTGYFVTSDPQDLYVGAEDDADHFDGFMDELRFWSDIRTGSEITNNKDIELVGNEANLEAYWKFENDFTDETANGNDLGQHEGDVGFVADTPVSPAATPTPTPTPEITPTPIPAPGIGNPFNIDHATGLFSAMLGDVSTSVGTALLAIFGILAALLGLGFAIRHVKSWITGRDKKGNFVK